jgi:hypothetical protein
LPTNESENLPLPAKYSTEYLRMHLDKAREGFWKAARQDGIADYSLESLERLDEVLSGNIKGAFAEIGSPDPDLATLWFAHAIYGSYFGDVLVDNLKGRWKYPNHLVRLLGLIFGRPDWIYRRWFVVVGRRKIPVFVIAMRRNTLGKGRASFSRVYKEIAAGRYRLT